MLVILNDVCYLVVLCLIRKSKSSNLELIINRVNNLRGLAHIRFHQTTFSHWKILFKNITFKIRWSYNCHPN
jgi:hypothetical protein